jgi:hypothetical protein
MIASVWMTSRADTVREILHFGVARTPLVSHDPRALVFVWILWGAPGARPILLLTLAIALYLTVIELRELDLPRKWWAWWLSLVVLTHFVGYLALRAYAAYRRRNSART